MTKPISKSKRQLAQLLIEVGVTQFPDGANWAAQDKRNPPKDDAAGITLYTITPEKPLKGGHYWGRNTTSSEIVMFVETNTLIPNWHQTVLSRDEFDQIVAETVVESEPQPVPTTTPTLDQLLQDWRNADDYAQRKQDEADEAAAMRDERWQAVQARAGEMGVTVGRCESAVGEPEPDEPTPTSPSLTFSNGTLGKPNQLPAAEYWDEVCDGCGKRLGLHYGIHCNP